MSKVKVVVIGGGSSSLAAKRLIEAMGDDYEIEDGQIKITNPYAGLMPLDIEAIVDHDPRPHNKKGGRRKW